jgi:site-specific recombinase XerC
MTFKRKPDGWSLGRHDYGTRVLSSTGNLAAVMKTMGHRDVKTAIK